MRIEILYNTDPPGSRWKPYDALLTVDIEPVLPGRVIHRNDCYPMSCCCAPPRFYNGSILTVQSSHSHLSPIESIARASQSSHARLLGFSPSPQPITPVILPFEAKTSSGRERFSARCFHGFPLGHNEFFGWVLQGPCLGCAIGGRHQAIIEMEKRYSAMPPPPGAHDASIVESDVGIAINTSGDYPIWHVSWAAYREWFLLGLAVTNYTNYTRLLV